MKIGLITDTHFNFKKANRSFHDYFGKFYSEIFFPTLEKEKISTVIHLGDSFDNRKVVDYWALEWSKKNVYDIFKKMNVTVYNIIGNHDSYYKDSNKVNSISSLLEQYNNIICIDSPREYAIDGKMMVFLPWICSDNQKETFRLLEETDSKIVFGHLELNGFSPYPGHIHSGGMNKDIFNKFDRVFSGHYHTKSDDGKIFYLGNPYQMFWSDLNDKRGFHIFDTENYSLKYFENTNKIFEKIYYDETEKEFDYSSLKNKIVKVIVKKKEDHSKFEKFVDRIYFENPLELKIIENIDIFDDDVDYEDVESEDTVTILDKYVEESEFNLNKDKVKKMLREIYKEALEVE